MAVYRYIYVFLVSIFACISIVTKSYAVENGRGDVYVSHSFKSNHAHRDGTSLLHKILHSVDEGILVSNHIKTNVSATHSRDRDFFPIAWVVSSRWQISTAALYFFFPAVRAQVEEFIPIVRLLIFPKHWFW